jgi:hypothetical protein
VLASHSHYVMEDVYQTPYWQKRKAVLDGWIVGTAGAERYRLPEQSTWAKFAKTDVYGYLVGTVSPDGSVRFNFEQIDERDIPPYVSERYEKGFVNWCFTKNKK